ncbi:ribokinase [Streptomyces physcomitrii]|uniref:Ribokinase n=1 Tax=Streptomyces physcomitrii TaxID=2724184 RepID=A0ABX1GZY4_9ACTN|nr:ribokinase [Streptomyces physcomitrii]NKI41348.1 ribokinase [Streptomyces physcomitrii]
MTAVVVLGSINMDLTTYVARAPRRGETVTGHELRTLPGGKGANQAVAAARAGASEVAMIGAVGTDAYGPALLAELAHNGVDTDLMRTVEGPSGTAHIVVDAQGSNAIVVIPGANGTLTHLPPGDEALIATADTLLLQLEIPMSGVLAAAKAAHRHTVRTVLTPSPARELPAELLAVTDLLVLNEREATALTGQENHRTALAALLEKVPEAVLTLGAEGCLYASREHEPLHVPAPKVETVDTTGAGDTFVGALAVALGEGRTMPQALSWAVCAAALAVTKPGAIAAMPFRSEIEDGDLGGS